MHDLNNCDENGHCGHDNQARQNMNSNIQNNSSNGTIWYFGDPLCSWCWGISNEIKLLRERYEGILDFEIVLGGLRPGGGDVWNDEFKEFLRKHWNHVALASDATFNHDILKLETFDYDTEPPARGVVVIKFIHPEKAFDFMRAVSHRFYVLNQDPSDDEFYRPICDEMDIDFGAFRVLFHSQKMRQETLNEFQRARDFDVKGFPTVLLEHKKRYTVITRGFNIAARLEERIQYTLDKSRRKEEEKRKLND